LSIIARHKNNQLKQLFHIENSVDQSVQQVLSLRIGEGHAAFSITNKSASELFQLAVCTIEGWDQNELADFIAAYPVLQHSFYQVFVAYDFSEATVLPQKDYYYENAGLLLSSLYGKAAATITIAEPVADWQIHTVYGVPKQVQDWVTNHFPSAQCRHQYSIGIKNVANTENGSFLVDFRKNDFTIIAERKGKLLLIQTYAYSTPEDVLYYMLKIAAVNSLSASGLQIQLSGLVDQKSALYKELYQYFLHIEFRDSSWKNAEYPAHFFTSLNDLARCAS
jgi:Protein of unknown function (DUF3822)